MRGWTVRVWVFAAMAAGMMTGCQGDAMKKENTNGSMQAAAESALAISSPAFEAGALIPGRFTCDGENIAPELVWSGVPVGTESLVLVCDDPDAPSGTWTHWIVAGINPQSTGAGEDSALPDGAMEIRNSFGRTSYGGPCPPSGRHRYFFKLYALAGPLPEALSLENYDRLLEQHALARAEYMGTYQRQGK